MEGAAGFRIVAGGAPPVAGQRSDCPEDGENREQFAAGNARFPCAERAQCWNHGRRRHSRRPHDCLGCRAGFLHRGLLRLHAKERKMLKHPTHAGGIALWVFGASDGVESEANAEKAPDGPVRDSVAEEVEESPGGEHGYDGCGFRGGGSCQGQGGTTSYEASNLNCVSGDDGNAAEDLSLRRYL